VLARLGEEVRVEGAGESAAGPSMTPEQLETFYAAHYPRLVKVLVVLDATIEEAEDAVQKAMMDLVRRCQRLQAPEHPAAYVQRAAINYFVKERRRERERLPRELRGGHLVIEQDLDTRVSILEESGQGRCEHTPAAEAGPGPHEVTLGPRTGGGRMNVDGKLGHGTSRHDGRAGDLAEQLSLLETVDRRVTPGHVARRFRELQRALGDEAGAEATASAQPGTATIDREYARAAAPGIEQPTSRATLVIMLKPLSADAQQVGIEQPTPSAKLIIWTDLMRPREQADDEQPSVLAKFAILIEPLPRRGEL
jgi:Sigma-70 region 2